MARSNLAVWANNLAIVPGHSDDEAIKLLYEALYWQPGYESSKANLQNYYMSDPAGANEFATHVARAERRTGKADLLGAIVEYRWALALKNDGSTQNKLSACEKRLASVSKP
jgi:hypothetical protein